MKGKNNRKYIPIYIILILVLYMNGCGGSEEESPGAQNSLHKTEVKTPAPQNKIEKVNHSDFEKEALVALELHPSVPDAIYDIDAPVVIKVELYSPRSFAVSNHNQYKTKEAEAIKLPEAKVDQSGKPWWQELTLTFTSPDGKSGELSFYANASPGEGQPNLGQGEVGSLEIIIRENSFPQAGKYNLKSVWKNTKYGRIESDALPLTLEKDKLKPEERDLLRVKVLLARKENVPALQLIKKLAEKNPDSYAIRYHLAEAHEKNDNLKEALTHYQKALTLFPKETPGEPWEPPIGLYIKLRELMEKLKNHEKQLISKTNHVDQN